MATLDGHPPLPADEVHVWRASLRLDAPTLHEMNALLGPDERARAARFHHDADRARYVAARGILRTLLGRYLARPAAAVAFVHGAHGKPALASDSPAPHPLRFNLAHAGDVALYAFALGREVGVDVEPVPAELEVESIAGRYFSPGEAAELRALAPAARARAFADGWTRKEAYLKGRGSGLARPLSDFTVSLAGGAAGADRVVSLLDDAGGGSGEWVLYAIEPGGDEDDDGGAYAAALAVERGRDVTVRRLRWPPRARIDA